MRFQNRDISQSLQPRTKSAKRMIWDESALHCVHFFVTINGSGNLQGAKKMRPTLNEQMKNIKHFSDSYFSTNCLLKRTRRRTNRWSVNWINGGNYVKSLKSQEYEHICCPLSVTALFTNTLVYRHYERVANNNTISYFNWQQNKKFNTVLWNLIETACSIQSLQCIGQQTTQHQISLDSIIVYSFASVVCIFSFSIRFFTFFLTLYTFHIFRRIQIVVRWDGTMFS